MKRILIFIAALVAVACTSHQTPPAGIHSEADFIAFARDVNGGATPVRWQDSTGVVRLHTDLDLSAVEGWRPIGEEPLTAFRGVFDGGGQRIKGLRVKSDSLRVGLFGINTGTIRNLTLAASVRFEAHHPQVLLGALCAENHGLVEGCVSEAELFAERGCVGGLVGRMMPLGEGDPTPQLRLSEHRGEVRGLGNQTGGLVGWSYRAAIDSCLNRGAVVGEGWFAGGICGMNGGRIAASINDAAVSSRHFAGGIVGVNSREGVVEDCTNRGRIEGEKCGAMVGEAEDGSTLRRPHNEGAPSRDIGENKGHVHTEACRH